MFPPLSVLLSLKSYHRFAEASRFSCIPLFSLLLIFLFNISVWLSLSLSICLSLHPLLSLSPLFPCLPDPPDPPSYQTSDPTINFIPVREQMEFQLRARQQAANKGFPVMPSPCSAAETPACTRSLSPPHTGPLYMEAHRDPFAIYRLWSWTC